MRITTLPTISKFATFFSFLTSIRPEALANGVVTASTGSHGLALAWAASRLNAKAIVCVPSGTSENRIEAIRAYGTEVRLVGMTYDEALKEAQLFARNHDICLLEATNDDQVLAGAATITLEILREKPDLDAMVLAVGGGSHAAGAVSVLHNARRLDHCRVFGVQARLAPAIHDSWHARQSKFVQPQETIAEGLATSTVYDSTFGVLLEGLSGFVTVTEVEISDAIKRILTFTGNLVEGAGAVGLAGLFKLRGVLAGSRVVIVLTGANPTLAMLQHVLGLKNYPHNSI